MKGTVQKGERRGSELGFPTANIPLTDESISGIYAARARIQNETPRAAAVFVDRRRKLLEAHILDFSDDLYGREITIELHKKIREDQAFDDAVSLREAIAADVKAVRAYFQL